MSLSEGARRGGSCHRMGLTIPAVQLLLRMVPPDSMPPPARGEQVETLYLKGEVELLRRGVWLLSQLECSPMRGTTAENFVVLGLRLLALSFLVVGILFIAVPNGVLDTLSDLGD